MEFFIHGHHILGFFYFLKKDITGYDDEELKNMSWKHIMNNEDRENTFQTLIKAINDQNLYFNLDVNIINKDGESKTYSLHNFLGFDQVSKRPISSCIFIIPK